MTALSSSRSKLLLEPPYSGPSWFTAAVVLIVALLLQVTVMHAVTIRGAEPSLVLVAVVWFAVRSNVQRAAIYGLAAGLCEDVLSTQTGGAWTISTTLAAVIAGTLARGFFADAIGLVALLTATATLLRALFFWIVMALQGYPSGLATLHFHQALVEALANAVIMIVAILIIRRVEQR